MKPAGFFVFLIISLLAEASGRKCKLQSLMEKCGKENGLQTQVSQLACAFDKIQIADRTFELIFFSKAVTSLLPCIIGGLNDIKLAILRACVTRANFAEMWQRFDIFAQCLFEPGFFRKSPNIFDFE